MSLSRHEKERSYPIFKKIMCSVNITSQFMLLIVVGWPIISHS